MNDAAAPSPKAPWFDHSFLICDRSGRVFWRNVGTCERLRSCPSRVHFRRVLCAPSAVALMAEVANSNPGFETPAASVSKNLAGIGWTLAASYYRIQSRLRWMEGRFRQDGRNTGTALSRDLEELRVRLARQLHSGAGQPLAATKFSVEVIHNTVPQLPPSSRSRLERVALPAQEALSDLRSMKLWEKTGIQQSFEACFDVARLSTEPPEEIKIAICRAAQEAFSNVIRHSRASRVSIALRERGRSLKLSVTDSGHGFDPKQILGRRPQAGTGIGLSAKRTQVLAMDAELLLESTGNGTRPQIMRRNMNATGD